MFLRVCLEIAQKKTPVLAFLSVLLISGYKWSADCCYFFFLISAALAIWQTDLFLFAGNGYLLRFHVLGFLPICALLESVFSLSRHLYKNCVLSWCCLCTRVLLSILCPFRMRVFLSLPDSEGICLGYLRVIFQIKLTVSFRL